MINRAVLDEILYDHGISRERLVALKIKLEEGRGPICKRLSRFLLGPKARVLGIYFAPGLKEEAVLLLDPPPPRQEREETILLYPEEMDGYRDKNPSGVLAHECGHAITGVGRKSYHPLYLLYHFLPTWCDRALFIGAVLSFARFFLFSWTGMEELAGRSMIIGIFLVVFVIMLPLLCYAGYYRSPNEVAAREKAVELLADPHWEQVISSDS